VSEMETNAKQLSHDIADALDRMHLNDLVVKKDKLDLQTQSKDFWDTPQAAQKIIRQKTKLEQRIAPWLNLHDNVKDLLELISLSDKSIHQELEVQLKQAIKQFTELKDELKLSGKYDDYDVILSIYAGAGGTDAQDWASMLLRMYIRWAEKNRLTVDTINEAAGDEAGIKSTTIEISGPFVYGRLKGEHGVHRLVRLSPFNSDNLRHTSFAKVDVLPRIDSPDDLLIDDKELRIDVYRSGGHGGQSVNTTDSAVRVTHLPTGITVAIQNERSQLQNKEAALTILRSRLTQLQLEQHKEHI
jgi:peptide chain release factor 2